MACVFVSCLVAAVPEELSFLLLTRVVVAARNRTQLAFWSCVRSNEGCTYCNVCTTDSEPPTSSSDRQWLRSTM